MPGEVRRVPASAWALLAPAVVVALGVCLLEGYRLIRPESRLFSLPPAGSFAEALVDGTVEQAYAFIRSGTSPNAPLTIQHPDFAEGRAMSASPLVLAVGAGNANAVLMLLSNGARLDLPENLLAICLADELQDPEVLEVLPLVAPPPECPQHVLAP